MILAKLHHPFLLAATLLAFHCGTYRPAVKSAAVSDSRKLSEASLFAPKKKALPELITLNTGEVEVETSLLLDLKKEPSLKNTSTPVPVLAHLIRHPQHGDILIDTGFDSTFARSGHGNFGCLAVFFNIAKQKPGQDIASQLKAYNAQLKAVWFTHMHVDHTAGAPELPKNIPYFAGKGTLSDSFADIFGLCLNHLDGLESVSEIDFAALPEVAELGRVYDIFGDGTLWAIHTPGHSAGHISFLVNTIEGPKLLTGDASHTGYGFQKNIAPGKTQDKAQSEKSLQALRGLAARHKNLQVIFGHDPDGSYIPEKK